MRWAMTVDEYSVDRSGAGKPATETFLGAKEFVPCAPPRPYSFSMPEVEANASVTDKLRIRVAMTPPPLGLRQTGSGLPVWRKGDKKFSISARLNDGAVRENVDEFVAFNLYQAESRNTIVDGTRLRYLNMEFDVSAAVIKLDDIQIQYAGGDLNKHGDPTAPAVWAVAGQYRAE